MNKNDILFFIFVKFQDKANDNNFYHTSCKRELETAAVLYGILNLVSL